MPATSCRRRLIFRSIDRRILHRQPLVRGAGLRNQRVHAGRDAPDAAARPRVLQHHARAAAPSGRESRRGPRRSRSAGRSCSTASGSRSRSAKIRSARSRISSFVTVLLMTRRSRSDPVSGAIVIDRSPLFAQPRDDRLGEVVEAQRRRADAVAHPDQALQDVLDVRVIAERDRHEADAVRVRPRGLGEREDAVGVERAHRQVVVARPAEAAQVRAARARLRSGSRDPNSVSGVKMLRVRRVEALGRLDGRLPDRHGRVACPGAARRPAMPPIVVVARRRTATACRSRARRRAREQHVGAARGAANAASTSAGTSSSPSPAAITSANGASGSGLTNVTAPPITTSGCARRALARAYSGRPASRSIVRTLV